MRARVPSTRAAARTTRPHAQVPTPLPYPEAEPRKREKRGGGGGREMGGVLWHTFARIREQIEEQRMKLSASRQQGLSSAYITAFHV